MIYIDTSKINIPAEWLEQSQRASEELRRLPPNERADYIRRHSNIWQELKPALEAVSHNKCWYCEAAYTRADFHVDHHRPKNRITNDDGTREEGYWWLAFEKNNLRLACSYCNCLHTGEDGVPRGKSDSFPLYEHSSRADSPAANAEDEIPLLLDPTKPTDPILLWFLDGGQACPRYQKTQVLRSSRAETTIKLLNLNDIKIVEERRQLWFHCISLIELGNRAFVDAADGSPSGTKDFEFVLKEILELTDSSSEFSAAARACFRGSSQDWVRDTVR